MQQKGLLIYRINQDDAHNLGVIRKCKAQFKAFLERGMEVDRIWLCEKGVLKNEELIYPKMLTSHSVGIYLFYLKDFGRIVERKTNFRDYDFLYLRHPFFDPLLVRMLRRAKKSNPRLKVILEINTYPYDAEPKRFLHKLSLWLDQWLRKRIGEFVDVIAHYGLEKEIWGIPTISLRNGIDLDEIPLSKAEPEEHCFRLIAVGHWSYWHGLDRLLQGIANYYQEKRAIKVRLTIVGDGAEKQKLEKLAKDLQLAQVVQFFPFTGGAALEAFFATADMGVGTLGLHRKAVKYDSSLKHRAYASRGLPLLLAGVDLDFPVDLPFVHYLPADETAIDLAAIVKKWQEMKSREDLKTEIRTYAENNLSWTHQLAPIQTWLDTAQQKE